jgi:branched-chain amino acid transport system substrate-binding protein
MPKKKIYALIVYLLLQVILVSCQQTEPPQAAFQCTDAIGCVTIQPGQPIKIGVLQALSGGAATFGTTQANSIQMAVEDRENTLLGHPIELQVEDSQCTAEGGANAALKIAADPQILGILGPSCSGEAVEAGKIMSPAGLVMIASSTSAPSLTSVAGERGADWQAGYFRTMANDALLGEIVANFALQELALTKAAVIDDGDAYTKALTAAFAQAFSEQGGEVVLSATVNKGDEDMVPVLTAVANSEAELLFFPIFQPEGDLIVQQIKEVPELEDLVLIGGAVLIADAFIENVGEDGMGMYFVSVAPGGR